MTITTLTITYIASISLAFFLGRKSVTWANQLHSESCLTGSSKTKKDKAGSYTGEEEKGATTGSMTPNTLSNAQLTPIYRTSRYDLDPDKYVMNLAKEALVKSEDILMEISKKK